MCHSKCDTSLLHQAISDAFPSYAYSGQVMEVARDASDYEDESDNLDVKLYGKSWKELDPTYVEHNEDDYLLMNSSAASAFLAAWLWRAAEGINGPNRIRASLAFHLATHGGRAKEGTGLWGGCFAALTQVQRSVLQSVLECANASAPSEEREQLKEALKSIQNNHSESQVMDSNSV